MENYDRIEDVPTDEKIVSYGGIPTKVRAETRYMELRGMQEDWYIRNIILGEEARHNDKIDYTKSKKELVEKYSFLVEKYLLHVDKYIDLQEKYLKILDIQEGNNYIQEGNK